MAGVKMTAGAAAAAAPAQCWGMLAAEADKKELLMAAGGLMVMALGLLGLMLVMMMGVRLLLLALLMVELLWRLGGLGRLGRLGLLELLLLLLALLLVLLGLVEEEMVAEEMRAPRPELLVEPTEEALSTRAGLKRGAAEAAATAARYSS
jgi:hypothetical protein